MRKHPAKIIAEIAAKTGAGSVKAKSDVVTSHLDVAEFTEAVQYALDPYKQFYLNTLPIVTQVANITLTEAEQVKQMFDLLDKLSQQTLAPNSNEARKAYVDWASQCCADSVELFKKIVSKDLKCGMTAKSFNKLRAGWIPEFAVQLAEPFNNKRLTFPCLVEPKYDGERCLIFVKPSTGSVEYLSRSGKAFLNFNCFSAELLKIFASAGDVVIDSEVVDSRGFQVLMRVPKLHDPSFDVSSLELVVFDFMPASAFYWHKHEVAQKDRSQELAKLFKSAKKHIKKVRLIDSRLAKDINEVEQLFEYWVEQGLEGIIIKQAEGNYTFSRSDAWMKMKPTNSEDLEIKGIELGTVGSKREGKCGALVLHRKKPNGEVIEVRVGSGLTQWDADNIVVDGEQILYKSPTDGQLINIKGKLVEVTFDCETEDGSLRFPRVKRRGDSIIRLDKVADS